MRYLSMVVSLALLAACSPASAEGADGQSGPDFAVDQRVLVPSKLRRTAPRVADGLAKKITCTKKISGGCALFVCSDRTSYNSCTFGAQGHASSGKKPAVGRTRSSPAVDTRSLPGR